MNLKFFLPVALLLLGLNSQAQCPTNEADLADGGTFSGNCTIAIGGNITITGNVIWNSGTLTLTGNNGDFILNGATFTVNGGSVVSNDGNDGAATINSGGSLIVASGATFAVYQQIVVANGGSITANGTVRSTNSYVTIDAGGAISVGSAGTLSNGGGSDITINGTLTNAGTISSGDDIYVAGTLTSTSGTITTDGNGGSTGVFDVSGTATLSGTTVLNVDQNMTVSGTLNSSVNIDVNGTTTVTGTFTSTGGTMTLDNGVVVNAGSMSVNGGTMTIGNGGADLRLQNGGSFTLGSGATASVADDLFNSNNAGGITAADQGLFVINGTMTVGGDVLINNTNPNSSLLGVGCITAAATFVDNEPVGDFEPCGGAGVQCCGNGVDVQPFALISPASPLCAATNQTVTVQIKNNATKLLDIATNNVTVAGSVTGPNPATFTSVTLATGTLAAGATQNVTLSTTYNMSTSGAYNFSFTTTSTNDRVPGNNTQAFAVTVQAAVAGNSISTAGQTFCGSGDPPNLVGSTPTGGSGTYAYQWQSSPDNSAWTNVGGATAINYDPATISATTYYRRNVTSGACTTPNSSASVLFTIEPAIAGNTITADQTFCGSGDPAQLNGAVPTGGSGAYTYQWQSSPDNTTWTNIGAATAQNYDPTTISATTYYRRGVSSGSCAMVYSASVQITIEPAIAGNTITADQTFCGSGDPAQLNGAVPTGGSGAYTYQWQSSPDNTTWTNIGAATAQNYDPSTISATTYYRRGVSSGSCAMVYSASVQITIEPAIANNTITADQTFCGSGDPAQLNGAVPTGGSGAYTYQWQSSPDNTTWTNIGAATAQNYDPTTISATTYYRRGVSSGSCAMVYSASVQITIEPAIAGNTITADQTFCASGDPAQLNGAVPTGGSGAYTYQWQSSPDNTTWTNIGAATAQNYDPTTISATTYYRRGVSSGSCAMVYSASVQITIEPAIAGNTITADQTFCGSGDPAQLNGAVPTGGSGAYTYQWQSSPDNTTWTNIGAATAQNYDPTTISATTYYRRGVSSGSCAMVYSASVQITIEPAIAGNTITADQTFCGSGDPAQLNGAVPTGGSGAYTYQWQSSPDNTTWTNIGAATAQNYDPTTISATAYYRRGVSSGSCAMVYSASVQITIEPAIAGNTITADQTFCGSGDPAQLNGAVPTGGSGAYTYQWQSSPDNTTWTNIGAATAQNYDPATISATTYYRRGVSSGSCAMVYSTSVQITIEPAIANNTITADQTFCGSGDPAQLNGSVPTGGSGAYTYQWEGSADNIMWFPIPGATGQNYDPPAITSGGYARRIVSSGTCTNSTSNIVTITVEPAIANNTITADQTFCGSGDPAQLNGAVPTGGSGAYIYQWQSSPDNTTWTNIGAATAQNYDPTTISATTYYRRGVSSGSCAMVYSASVQITIEPAIAGNTITAAQTFCASGDPAQLNGSVPTGGSGAYTYQWQSSPDNTTWTNIGAATAQNYDPTTISATTYYRRGVSSGSCAMVYSTSVQITIEPAIAGNTITADQTFCGSGDPAQLNGAVPTGGSGAYTYQWEGSADNIMWFPIPGATGQNYDPPAITSGGYARRIVSSGTCTNSTSNTVTITVEPAIAGNTITADQTFCGSGDPAQLNGAVPTGGSGAYTYQWQSSPDNTTWTNIGAATAQNYDPTTISATTYYRRGVSSGSCAMVYSASVQITIEPAIAGNTITAAQTFCASGDPAQLNGAVPTGGSGAYTYQWQSSPDNTTWTNIGAATAQNYDPTTISSTTYYRRGVSSGSCAMVYSASVQITIEPAIAGNTITADQTFCAIGDPAQLNGAVPTGGSGAYTYQWQSSPDNTTWTNIGAATAQNYDPATISATTYYRRGVSSGSCAMVYSTSVQITIEPAIAGNTITAPQTFCGSGDPANLVGSTPSGGNGVFAYQWQSSPDNATWADIGGATAIDYDPSTLLVTTYYRRGVSSGACASLDYSSAVAITIEPAITNNTISAAQSFCVSGDPAQLNGSAPTGGSGTYSYQWQSSPDDATWTDIGGATSANYDPATISVTTYYRRGVSSGSCAIVYSSSVQITVFPAIATNTIAASQTFCGSGDPALVVGSTPTGGTGAYTFQWQASIDNITWFALGGITTQSFDPPTVSSTVYLRRIVSSGSCTPSASSSVVMTVEPAIANNSISTAQTFCGNGDPASLTGSVPTGGNGTYAYQWQSSPDDATWTDLGGATLIDYDPSSISTTTYYRRGVNSGSCSFVYSSSVKITIEPVIANNTISSAQTFCVSGDPVSLTGSAPTGGNGTYAYQWQSSPDDATWTDIGGATLIDYDPAALSSTTYYRRGVNSGTCSFAYSSSVKITIEPAIANNTISSAQTFCASGDPAALIGSVPTGGNGTFAYQWQSSPDDATWTDIGGATAIDYDPATISSTTYYRRGVSSGTCAIVYSSSIKITIEPAIANNTISSAQTFCASGDPNALIGSVPTGGNGTFAYQWQSSPDDATWTDIGGATTIGYDPSTILSTTYYRRGVSSGFCSIVYSSSIEITIEPAIANNTITAPQTFCGSGDPSQLNGSSPTGGDGVTYTYDWESSADNVTWASLGVNSQDYDPTTISSTTYFRRGVSSGSCAMSYSASVQITIEPSITGNAITASQTFCVSGDPLQLNGGAVSGGNGTFTYDWQSSPDNVTWTSTGVVTANYDPTTISSTTYFRRGVSSGSCAMTYSPSITITIEPAITNNVISANQTFCTGGDPSLLAGAAPSGGNAIYSYQWQISSDNTSWTDIVGANSQDFDPGFIIADTYFRRAVTSGTCATDYSNSVYIKIEPAIANNSLPLAGNQTFCVNGDPVTIDGSTPTGGSGVFAYVWESSPDNATWTLIGGATGEDYDPTAVSSTTYFRRGVSGGSCITIGYSNSVQILIQPAITGNTIGSDQKFCAMGDPALLTGVVPTGGSGAYTYDWLESTDNSTWTSTGITTPDYDPATLTDSSYYRRVVSSGSCPNDTSSTVTIAILPDIANNTITADQVFCGSGDPVALSGSAPTGGDGSYTYDWESSPDNLTYTSLGVATAGFDPSTLAVTTYFRRVVNSAMCAANNSVAVQITIQTPIANNLISADQSYCGDTDPAQLNGTVPTGGSGVYTYDWLESTDNISYTSNGATTPDYDPGMLNATTYYKRVVLSGSCTNDTSSEVTITIQPGLTNNIISSDQTYCGNADPAALSGTLPIGGNGTYIYKWQSSPDNVTYADLGVATQNYDPSTLSTTTYYRRLVTAGSICPEDTSNVVTITIQPALASNTISADQSFCGTSDPTLLTGSTPTGGTGIYSYEWIQSTDNISWTATGSTTPDFDPATLSVTTYYKRVVSSGICSNDTSSAVTITIQPGVLNNTISASQTFCVSGNPANLVGSLPTGGNGTFAYDWQSSPDGITWTSIGVTTQSYDPPVTSTTTYFRRGVSSGLCLMNYSLPVTITVHPAIATNVIASSQTFCGSGDPVNIVGSTPTGGNGAYGYSWQFSIDNISWFNLGVSTQSYDPPTVNSTIFLRRAVTSAPCATNFSASVEMRVEPPITSNTISADQTFCASGDPVALVGSSPAGGNGIFAYQWQSSPDNATWTDVTGANLIDFDPSALTTTTYFRRGVSSSSCTFAYSASVKITIQPAIANNTITADQTYCTSGDPALLVGTLPTGGDGVTYSYQWQSSSDAVVWTNIASANTIDFDPATTSATTYFRRGVSSGTCAFAYSDTVTIAIELPVSNNTISSNQTFCVSGDPVLLTGTAPTNGNGVYAYDWLESTDNINWTSTGVTTPDYDPGMLSDTTYFRRVVVSGICSNDTSNVVTILVYPALTNNTISGNQNFCVSGDPAMLTGTTPAGASGTYSYNWITSSDNVVWTSTGITTPDYDPATLTDTAYFKRVVMSGVCSNDTSNLVTIIVTPGISGNTISGNQTFCVSGDPVLLTGAVVTGGNGVYSYGWVQSTDNINWTSTGVTTPNFDPGMLNDTTYFRRVVMSGVCSNDTSNAVTILVYPALANNTISADQTFCASGDPVMLTGSVPSGASGSYTFDWIMSTDNIVWTSTGITTPDYDPATLTDTTYFKRVVISGACSNDTSNLVTIIVTPGITGNSISADQTFCVSGDPAMLTGGTVAGGTGIFAYDWLESTDNINWVSTGITTPDYDPGMLTGTTYFRRVVTSGVCANDTSAAVTILILPAIANNTIGANQTFCISGDPAVLIGSTPSGGTGVYGYEWLESTDNVIWTSTGITTPDYDPATLTDTTYYRRVVTSGSCQNDTSVAVVIIVQPALTGNTISADQTFCGSGDPALLVGSTPSGATGVYAYDWITSTDNLTWVSTGITTQNYDPATLTDTTYFRRVVLSGVCANDTSNLVTIVVQPPLAGNTISADQTFCVSGDPALLTGGTVTGGSGVYAYDWLESTDNINWVSTGITTPDYDPGMLTDTAYYRRVVVSGSCTPDSSNSVTIIILPALSGNTISADQTFCGSGDPALLIGSSPVGATGVYAYDWITSTDNITWTSTGITTPDYDPATLTDTTYFKRVVLSGTCSNDTSNMVTIIVTPGIAGNTISADQTFCGSGDPALLTGGTVSGGSGVYTYEWLESADNLNWVTTGITTPDYDPGMMTGTTYFRRVVRSGICSNDSSNSVTIIIQPALTGNTISADQIFCSSGDPVMLTGSIPTGGSGTYAYDWITSTDNTTWVSTSVSTPDFDPGMLTTTTYYRRVVISGACNNDTSAAVTITISTAAVANAGVDSTICASSIDLYAATPTAGSGKWYVFAGTATFADDTDPATNVTGLSAGVNSFEWVVSQPGCIDGRDTVHITVSSTLAFTLTGTNSCGVASNGSLSFNAPAGYSYGYNQGTTFSGTLTQTTVAGVNTISSLTNFDYTVRLQDPAGCFADQTYTILSDPAPNIFNLTPTGTVSVCQNVGVDIGLNGSESGIIYQLQLNSVNIGAPVVGSTEAFKFPTQYLPGIYTVTATTGTPACLVNMNGTLTVTLNDAPVIDTVIFACSGGVGSASITTTATITSGTLEYSIDGTTFQASPTFSGLANGTYNVIAREAITHCSDTQSVIVTCNTAPVAVIDFGCSDVNGSTTVTVLPNDFDPDGDAIYTQRVLTGAGTSLNGGTFTLDTLGNLSYIAPAAYVGIDTITYQVCDIAVASKCASGKVAIKVSNARPVANNDTASVNKNGEYTSYVSVIVNDSTTDGGVFTVVPVTSGTTKNGGTYAIDNAGNFTYTPATDYVGEDQFMYIIVDRCHEDTGYVNIQIDDIFIPEGFSPNGDGSHDYFVIEGGEGYEIDIKVFNRWGSLVYQMNDYKSPEWWDGAANTGLTIGERLPDGTYYYIIDLNDGKKPRVRYITIKR